MFFPAPGINYEDADTSPILINTGVDTGEIPFTPTFKLLGSTLANNLKDDSGVELRIKSAQRVFSAISSWTQFFSANGIRNVHKKIAYEGLILIILLYGCESWSLPKLLLIRPESLATFSQPMCTSHVQGINVVRTRVQDHSDQP